METPEPAAQSVTMQEFHRKIATELFTGVFTLLDKAERTCAENDRMIHAAHASRYHWDHCGSPVNFAMGEWQCSRVHSALGQSDAAIYHGLRALELAEDHDLGPFHLGYAHEALARAFAGRDPAKAAHHLQRAHEIAAEMTDADEKAQLQTDLEAIRPSGAE